MKVSALIDRLITLRREHGDMDVFVDCRPDTLMEIGEVNVDAEDTGIIIWLDEPDEAA